MICSVYDYENRRFDLYRVDQPKAQLGLAFGAPARTPTGYESPLGHAPEAAAMPLPNGAVFVGTSPHPVGVMCRPAGGLGELTVSVGTTTVMGVIGTMAALGGVLYLYKKFAKAKPLRGIKRWLWGNE